MSKSLTKQSLLLCRVIVKGILLKSGSGSIYEVDYYVPFSRIGRVWTYEQIVFLIGDEVHPAHVHGLVAAVEANVALFGLARVPRRADDQALDVVEDALVFRVAVGHDICTCCRGGA